MTKLTISLVASLALLSTTACTWVGVSERGAKVVILAAEKVTDCKRLGEVNTSVKDSVLGIGRSREKVQTELDRLAQDQAVSLKANTLVRQSVSEGSASYIGYQCPESD